MICGHTISGDPISQGCLHSDTRREEISGAVRAKSITAFTSYDTLKGRRILRVGGDWGHKRTRMIKIWIVGRTGHGCRTGQRIRESALKKREDDNDNDNGNS